MAEITVSGGVTATLTPIFTLWYGHKDITWDIAPYVTSISYSDSIKNESDVIAITLEDTAGRWLNEWYPGKGDTLALHLGYQGEDLLNCGIYTIDKIDIAAPPSTINIDGIATSVSKALRTKNSQGFEKTTLSAIASRIAQKHGLTLVGQIAPLTIDRVTQYAETDVAFLRRLASEYGYTVKVTAKELIFAHLPTLRCLAPLRTLKRTDVTHYTFKDTINRIYKNATVQHQNSQKKELVIYTHDSKEKASARGASTSADTLKLNSRAPDAGAAQAKATAALDSHNEYQQTGTLTMMGCPQLTAGNKIELSEFGVLSGQWLIDKSMHKFTRSGYTTEIDISRGPATSQ
ncbi:phage late control D family protein [Superficieibacter sp. BNK-5]|uniref:phage late control D family protein n=1 Tax=Superficieibacter sp. BNK-5 TaxID=3376142 RepID=UPI0039BFE5CC